MKKVLGASIGALAITLMSFASPQEANIKGDDAQIISAQTGNAVNATATKPKPKPTPPTPPPPPPPKTYTDVIVFHTVVTISGKNLADLKDVIAKY